MKNLSPASDHSGRINTARATVASHATTADIWSALGNQIDWTGTAVTTAFPAAPQAGAERTLICAGACTFTAGANMILDGIGTSGSRVCEANDVVTVRALTTTQFRLSFSPASRRVSSASAVGSPLAWNSDTYEAYALTAQNAALTINADAGAPVNMQKMIFRIKDNGTARALTWTTGSSKSFRAVGVTLPTTTVVSKIVYVGCIFNAADDRWDVVAVAQEA